jgi:ASC-1-like (ASCH) protein
MILLKFNRGWIFMAAKVASVSHGSKLIWEAKPVRGEGREARMEFVRDFFARNAQDAARFKDVESGELKCRLLYEGDNPKAIFVHTRKLESLKDGFPENVDVKIFSLLDSATHRLALSVLFDKVIQSAKEERAKSVAFHIGPDNGALKQFLEGKDCTIVSQDKTEIVMARLLEGVQRKRGREDDEEEAAQPGPAHVDKRERKEPSKPVQFRQERELPPLGVTLKKMYIHQIRSGVKTIEGRINSGMFQNVQVGRLMRFFYFSDQSDDVVCRITKVAKYKSFTDMLQIEGFRQCVNEARDLTQAIQIYDGIPGYREKAQRFGVIGFHLEVVKKN